jgi:hypothetical protein
MLVPRRRRHGGRANRIRGELPARTAPYLAVPFPLISRATCLILPSLRGRLWFPFRRRWPAAPRLSRAVWLPSQSADLREELRADGLRTAARFRLAANGAAVMPATERESARIPEDIDVLEEASWYIPQHEVAHVAMPGQKFVSGTRSPPPSRKITMSVPRGHCGAQSSGDGTWRGI